MHENDPNAQPEPPTLGADLIEPDPTPDTGTNARASKVSAILSLSTRHWCIATIALALFSLGFAIIILQTIMGLEACPLCVLDRIVILLITGVATAGAIHNPIGSWRYLYGSLIFILSGIGIGICAWHIHLQNLPADQVPSCGPGFDYIMDTFPLTQALSIIFEGSGECAEEQWTFLTLTIPEQTLLLFIVFAIFSVGMMWSTAGARLHIRWHSFTFKIPQRQPKPKQEKESSDAPTVDIPSMPTPAIASSTNDDAAESNDSVSFESSTESDSMDAWGDVDEPDLSEESDDSINLDEPDESEGLEGLGDLGDLDDDDEDDDKSESPADNSADDDDKTEESPAAARRRKRREQRQARNSAAAESTDTSANRPVPGAAPTTSAPTSSSDTEESPAAAARRRRRERRRARNAQATDTNASPSTSTTSTTTPDSEGDKDESPAAAARRRRRARRARRKNQE